MKNYITLSISLLLILNVSGQTGFSKIYNGCVSPDDLVNSFGNGFVTCGYGGIMNIDSAGNVIWAKNTNVAQSKIIRTSDSCYITVGYNYTSRFIDCNKFNINGDTVWNRAILPLYNISEISSVIETSDSSILITAVQVDTNNVAQNEMLIVKIGYTGSLIWTKTLYTANHENMICGIKEGPDKNYYAWGYVEYHTSTFYFNAVLMCISPSGNMIWNKTYFDGLTSVIMLYDIEILNSGILLFMSIGSNGIIAKTDSVGIPLWTNSYNFSGGATSKKCFFKKKSDDYLLATGGGGVILEIDTMGQVLKSYMTIMRFTTESFVLTPDSQFAFIAFGFSGPAIVRYDSLNSLGCVFEISNPTFVNGTLQSDSAIYTFGTNGTPVNFPMQFSSCQDYTMESCPDWESIEKVPTAENIELFPNPSSSILHFKSQYTPDKIELVNLNGQVVYRIMDLGISEGTIHLPDLSPGIYLVKFYFSNAFVTKRICFQGN